MKRITLGLSALLIALGGIAACSNDDGSDGSLVQLAGEDGSDRGFTMPESDPTILDKRVVDYSDAFRIASIKLVDLPPTLEQISALANASDKAAAYELLVDDLLESPRFSRRMIRFWRDTFRQGGGELDSAPIFAAQVMIEGRPYTDLFTASEGTCPTYDGASNSFVAADCDNGVAQHAGVLTNPGTMRQFYSHMAFRRVRWVQEVFTCQKFPAEYAAEPTQIGNASYTSPWNFDSISDAPINFKDVSSLACANCHTTMNHLAPLFRNFDENGQWQPDTAVFTPTAPDPIPTTIDHWLVEGEKTAWRLGVPAENLVELGKAMAADPIVVECAVARLWNFAMSKEDIVNDLASVPTSVISRHLNHFVNNDYNMKSTLRSILLSDDFVSF